MKIPFKLLLLLFLAIFSKNSFSQKTVEDYEPLKNDSLRIGIGENDFLPFIQSGYTLMLPENKTVKGVLILLEDSGYDKKTKILSKFILKLPKKALRYYQFQPRFLLTFIFQSHLCFLRIN